jgi:regulator of replication initiation timing
MADPRYEDRRSDERERREDDHVAALLEAIKAEQARGMGQVLEQIADVRSDVRAMVAKGNAEAIENVRAMTKLEARVEALEKDANETKAIVKPMERAQLKAAGAKLYLQANADKGQTCLTGPSLNCQCDFVEFPP